MVIIQKLRIIVSLAIVILLPIILIVSDNKIETAACYEDLSCNEEAVTMIDIGDLNNNGISEKYTLKDKHLEVSENDKVIWRSPEEYTIDSFVLGDANNDGEVNLLLSLWKKGSFGRVKPFWHDGEQKEDNEYKNHLFVYRLDNNRFKQVWCSSNLSKPIVSFSIRDTNDDGENELIVAEGKYRKVKESIYGLDTKEPTNSCILKWVEWGFVEE